jgi:RNA polymerase sigma-54 factor
MALDMKHSLRLQQQLKLTITPQLQQAIKLLQLTRLELQQTIKKTRKRYRRKSTPLRVM